MNRTPMTDLEEEAALRAQLLELVGACEWPKCGWPHDLELSHINPKGMGGRSSVNHLRNVWLLCRRHHRLFDGQVHDGLLRAMRDLAGAYIKDRRRALA